MTTTLEPTPPGAAVLQADRGAPPPPPATRRRWRMAARYALLCLAALIVVFPIYSTLVIAVQPATALLEGSLGILVPTEPTLRPFADAWTDGNLARALINSTIVATVITLAQVLTSVFAAYAFAYVRFPAKRVIFYLFLATLMVPTEVVLVAQFQIISDLNWINSYQGLVAPFLAFAFGTFMIRQAFLNVPRDLRDATALDGYGHLGFMRHVAVPLARPAIAGLAVFSFLLAWNQYLWPLLVADSERYRTVQIGLRSLAGQDVAEFNQVTAGVLIAALPIAALLILFQRHLVRGLTAGAVKG